MWSDVYLWSHDNYVWAGHDWVIIPPLTVPARRVISQAMMGISRVQCIQLVWLVKEFQTIKYHKIILQG
jgi:hypothetical protein